MAKYLLKSKILAALNETLNKIKLAEAEAVTTPPEMDSEGNFISSVETKKKPSARGVEVEQQIQDLSKDEVVKKAIEKIRDSVDVASDLDKIIKQILGDNNVSDQWKVNGDHNDVYLRSKDAHIFQQNDSICLSHHGKIEIFKTVDELHQWLKEHDWPLPPVIEIHESIDLQEAGLKTRCHDWNKLVDIANGEKEVIEIGGEQYIRDLKNLNAKPQPVTDFVQLGLDQGIEDFAGMPKIPNVQPNETKATLQQKLGLSDNSAPDLNKAQAAYSWIMGNQSSFTNAETNKSFLASSFANDINKALSSETKVPVAFGNKKYDLNKDNFQQIVKYIKRQRAYGKTIFNYMLNNEKNPLSPEFRQVIEQELKSLQQSKESYTVDDKIHNLLESSKKYPWLNEMINKNLMTEEDPIANTTSDFDSAVAGAGGMNISSDTDNSTTDTNTDSTFDPDTAPDLDLDNNDTPDLSSGKLGGGNFNLNINDDENSQIPQPNQKTYVVIDMVFKDSAEDDLQEQDASDIMVKLKDEETGEIIEKSLNEIDTL
jgi:hypothetical protein